MMPFRDLHPLKNVGQLPDMGEIGALLRLWALGTAVNMVGAPCKVHALRDPRRYPCYWHVPDQTLGAFSSALEDIVDALSLGDVLRVRDVDGIGDEESEQEFAVRQQYHKAAYDSELGSFMAELEQERCALMSSANETDFRQCMLGLPSGDILLPMVYPVLHRLPPSVWPDTEGVPCVTLRRKMLRRLLSVFNPLGEPAGEEARQALLWQALVGAAKYVASYRSRSARFNAFQVDDCASIVPGAVRLSIHNKSRDSNQFAVKTGMNMHRTPWHGTAELRYSKTERRVVIDTKLAAEIWHTHTAVRPCPSATLAFKSGTPAAAWNSYCARLWDASQPICFAEVDSLPTGLKLLGWQPSTGACTGDE